MLACRVYCRDSRLFGVGDSNEPKRRVRRGRLELALEGQQASADDIRLGGIELVREAFEAVALVGHEVHLQRSCFTDASTCHASVS